MSIDHYTDSNNERCVMVCSTSGRPLPLPAFESLEHAESFEDWVRRVHGKDPRQFDADGLEFLHTAWLALPKCNDCRCVLDDGRCGDCGDEDSEAAQ